MLDINKKSWEIVREMNADNLDAVAIEQYGEKQTYREMFETWDDAARAFTALGITRENGARVLMATSCSMDSVNMLYALDMTGAIPYFFLEVFYQYFKIAEMVRTHKITDIVIEDYYYGIFIRNKAKELRQKYGIRNIITVKTRGISSDMPFPLNLFCTAGSLAYRFVKNKQNYHDLLRKHHEGEIFYDDAPTDRISVFHTTTGSTNGFGKAVPFTDRNRNAMVLQVANSDLGFCHRGVRAAAIIGLASPYIGIVVVHTAMVYGGTLLCLPSTQFKVALKKGWATQLMDTNSNVIIANRLFWNMFMQQKSLKNKDLSAITHAVTGGIYTPAQELEQLEQFFREHNSKAIVINGYGATEIGGCCIAQTESFRRMDSMGILMSGVKAVIEDENGDYHIPGSTPLCGELFLTSDSLSPGFEDEKEVFETRIINGERYYRTKDIVDYRSDGSFQFVSRVDWMFQIYGGVKYYPQTVEKIFMQNENVDNCAIIGHQVSDGVNIPYLYLSLKDGVSKNQKTVEKIMSSLMLSSVGDAKKGNVSADDKKCSAIELPEKVILVDNIPMNKGGKNDYHKLKTNPPKGLVFNVSVNPVNELVKITPGAI